jgi:methylmalonyl-CoA/ethylmalonyl-CoA epimerase
MDLPPMDQVGFVYKNLEAAMELYAPMFGPFEVQEYGSFDYEYRGAVEPAELRIAFGKSGDIEIELIEWVAGPTPHKEFLDQGREGMHHLRFRVDNVDAKVAEAEQIGWKTVWYKQFGEGLAMAYMERDNDPLLIELFENHHG